MVINQHSLHTAQILHQLFFCRGRPSSWVTSAFMERLSGMFSVSFCKHNKNGGLFIRLACSSLVTHGSAVSVVIFQMFPWQRYFFMEEWHTRCCSVLFADNSVTNNCWSAGFNSILSCDENSLQTHVFQILNCLSNHFIWIHNAHRGP